MTNPPETTRPHLSPSNVWGVFELLFLGMALISFAGAVAIVLYEAWELVTGQGWNQVYVGAALDWLFGMPPLTKDQTAFHQALTWIAILPLDIILAVLGWLFSKISNGFEKLT